MANRGWMATCVGWMGLASLIFGVLGCNPPAPPPATKPAPTSNPAASTAPPATSPPPAANAPATWPDAPEIPFVPVMTEADGIKIPRIDLPVKSFAGSKVPQDVGNEEAAKSPSSPVDGDWLIVRFSAEPQSLNILIETSAYQQYITSYVNESFARQNPETLAYEPHIAKRWLIEDAVKLSADYPGSVRRIALGKMAPAKELQITVNKKEDSFEFLTTDEGGKPIGNVWVGITAAKPILGAPPNGYHDWSKSDGKVLFAGLLPGTYRVQVGEELVGISRRDADGSLELTPGPDNPHSTLGKMLAAKNQKSLKLAKGEWVDVQEKTVFTYFMRDDVKWSDGTPFTAKDVLFAYQLINNPFVDCDSLRIYYQDLVTCEPLDPLTIRMKYRQQYFKAFEFTLGLPASAPPRHQFEKQLQAKGIALTDERLTPEEEAKQKKYSVHGKQFGQLFNQDREYGEKPLGTGAYVVDKWVRGNRIELVRNKNYWNKQFAGHLDKLIFRFIADNVAALQALKVGEVDFIWPMTPEQYFEELDKPAEKEWFQKNYVRASWNTPGLRYCGWNMLRPLFQDRRVRIALSMLFDKQDFWEKKLHKSDTIVSGSEYYYGPAYDHEVKPIGFSPKDATDLLAEAGWIDSNGDGVLDKDGKKFEFELIWPQGGPAYESRALVMQKSYKDAGIIMKSRSSEWASLIDKIKNKDFDAVFLAWAQSLEGDPYQLWHSSGAGPQARGSNHCSFADPLADQLIETIRLTLDDKKRQKAHFSFARILDREQPYMFLYAPKDLGAYHKRFRGVKWYVIRPGFDLSEWYVPKELQLRGKN